MISSPFPPLMPATLWIDDRVTTVESGEPMAAPTSPFSVEMGTLGEWGNFLSQRLPCRSAGIHKGSLAILAEHVRGPRKGVGQDSLSSLLSALSNDSSVAQEQGVWGSATCVLWSLITGGCVPSYLELATYRSRSSSRSTPSADGDALAP